MSIEALITENSDLLASIIQDQTSLQAIKQELYTAIRAKGQILSLNPFSSYANAISGIVNTIEPTVANRSFSIGTEPIGGTVWYVKPDGTGERTGTSWDNAVATRQEAISLANTGDRIYVWEGTYLLNSIQTYKAGVSEYYGFNGSGSWETRHPFLHPSKHDFQFSSNNFNNTSVTFLDDQTIDGLWVQNVLSVSGLYLSARTHLDNCVIYNCNIITSVIGGGIYIGASGSMHNCIVSNSGSMSHGGGVYATAYVSISDCIFINCYSTSGSGGGLYATVGTIVTNSVFNNCTAAAGGGIYATVNSMIDKGLFVNCKAGNNGGGAYVITGVGVSNCILFNCTGGVGGGLSVATNCYAYNCVVSNCTATGGSGSGGGGIHTNNAAYICNCTVTNCNAATAGDNYLLNGGLFYNNISWGGNIYLALANYSYKIYNCASNFALTGITNWHTNADIQNFITLTEFPFIKNGIFPFDTTGSYSQSLPRSIEAISFVDQLILPNKPDEHLPGTSPLIGAGYYEAGVTPDLDADGTVRPLPPSIGAYEYVA